MGRRTILLTGIAMIAFAANSLLCRLALADPRIDPVSFSAIRLVSGALVLVLLVWLRSRSNTKTASDWLSASTASDWLSASMLFAYVALFSFAYLSLATGTGALILFGAVQLTMLSVGLFSGERFTVAAWAGLVLASAGLVYLVSPGLSAPSPVGAVMMALAGVAWGVYSILGRDAANPLAITASNFVRAVPLALMLSLITIGGTHVDGVGAVLAIASGALTSGIGYAIWYAALRGLTAMHAASVQLTVPPIAAIGGALALSEPVTSRHLLASAAILGGIAIVLATRSHRKEAVMQKARNQ